MISLTDEAKKANYELEREHQWYNDENHGMNEKEVQDFVAQTKIKTVESIYFGKHWIESWYFTPLP